jgi:AraC-like DNA-binding protein
MATRVARRRSMMTSNVWEPCAEQFRRQLEVCIAVGRRGMQLLRRKLLTLCQRVNVVSYLAPRQLTHLRMVLGQDHALYAADGWDAFSLLLRERMCDVAVVDPGASGQMEVAELVKIMEQFPATPLVLYATVVPRQMRAVSELARRGISSVVLYGFDDAADRFRRVLERRVGDPLAKELLLRLTPAIAQLDTATAAALQRLFMEPHLFRSADDIAAAAGCSRRTMYRQFADAGLGAPRLFVLGARVLRGFSLMRDPGHTIDDVARKLGFKSARGFSERTREMIGELATHARRRLTAENVLDRLARRLLVSSETSSRIPVSVS